jgi:hypothetical protein
MHTDEEQEKRRIAKRTDVLHCQATNAVTQFPAREKLE